MRLPVQRFRTLLDDLSGVALNRVRIPGGVEAEFAVATAPTQLQAHAFQILNFNPAQSVPITMTG